MSVHNNFYNKIKRIDKILTEKNNKDLLITLIKDRKIANYFFEKVESPIWFNTLKKENYFAPEKSPPPKYIKKTKSYFIPKWPILTYLEKLSRETNIPQNKIYINELLDFIINISNYRDSKGKHISNFKNWHSLIKILSNLPNDSITIKVIDLIPIWLDSKFDNSLQSSEIATTLFPKFLNEYSDKNDIEKAERIIEHMIKVKHIPVSPTEAKVFGKKKKYKFVMDFYYLKETFDKYSDLLAEKFSSQFINDFVRKIKSVLENKEDGIYWSFYEKTPLDDPPYFLIENLKILLEKRAKKKILKTKEIVINFIKDEYLTFQKMALYLIAENTDYHDLFWNNLDNWFGNNVLKDVYFGDELKNALKKIKITSEGQKKELKDIIEKGPRYDIDLDDKENYINQWKQRRYKALNHDKYFKSLYEKYEKITKVDAELKPGITSIEWQSGTELSPLTKEEILKKPNDKLADFIIKFKTENRWEGPTVDDLSATLKIAVQENPDKFVVNLNPFLEMGYLYVYDILWGLEDAWKNKIKFNWINVLNFIKGYIQNKGFWEDELNVEDSHWNADKYWVIKHIGNLIQEGTKSDEWAFDPILLPQAEKIIMAIIDRLLENIPLADEKDIIDPVTHALNSSFGSIITALLFIALRRARVEKKKVSKKKVRWEKHTKKIYESLLDNEIGEAFTIFGQYMPNFMYLDKSWTRKKISDLNEIKNTMWSYFMSGFLWGRPYIDLYELMKPHYLRGLQDKFKEAHAEERLIHHIANLYIDEIDKIGSDGLVDYIISKGKPSHFEIIVRFFRGRFKDFEKSHRKESKEPIPIQKEILDFWASVYNKYKSIEPEKLKDDDKSILSSLLLLGLSLPRIDKEYYNWIILSLTNLRDNYNLNLFIKDLNSLKDIGDPLESGKYIGKILVEITKKNIIVIYKDEVKNLVEFLYERNNPEIKRYADEICNEYAKAGITDERGELFMRDLYERYNE